MMNEVISRWGAERAEELILAVIERITTECNGEVALEEIRDEIGLLWDLRRCLGKDMLCVGVSE